jgi:DGQHR domain-containing protein
MSDRSAISCHALRVKQNEAHPVYLFALTATQLHQIADISRLARTKGGLEGYQRGIVKAHVENIAAYLNEPGAVFPNAIILALPSSVAFTERRGPNNDDGAAIAGHLSIPLPESGARKPAWIVDGQQRTTALAKVKDQDYPIPVAAFIADEVDLQRDQFIRINSVHPLDKSLVTELLPEVSLPISPRLAAKRLPSALVTELATRDDSPFLGLIRRASTPAENRKQTVVTDTSLVNAIEESLSSASGCLFPYRNVATGETDIEGIWIIVVNYWSAVREVFADAWGLPPTQSRLMHGVGIRSMGRLMDRMMAAVDPEDDSAPPRVRDELRLLAPHCHWTTGTWDTLGLDWNELQNVPRHIRMLSNYLVRLHTQERFGHR